MKKIKIMLLSLAVLAVVGGALAFKAKQLTRYCTSPLASGACITTCPTSALSTTVAAQNFVCSTDLQWYTTQSGAASISGCYYNDENFVTTALTCDPESIKLIAD